MDVLSTVESLGGAGCVVKVLQLGDMDLTSGGGKIVLATLAAVAEIERDILIERTNAGIARARADGRKFGRPLAATMATRQAIMEEMANAGRSTPPSLSGLARKYGVSRATISRIKAGAYA